LIVLPPPRDREATSPFSPSFPIVKMKEESDRDAAQRAIAEALRLDREDASAHALAGKIALDAEEPAKAVNN
jgi:hypothetical protein